MIEHPRGHRNSESSGAAPPIRLPPDDPGQVSPTFWDPVRIATAASDADIVQCAIVVNARRLLDVVDAGGTMKLVAGHLAGAELRVVVSRLWWGEGGEYDGEIDDPALPEPLPLLRARTILEHFDALKATRSDLRVTDLGLWLRREPQARRLYEVLFAGHFFRLNHPALDHDPPLALSWPHCAAAFRRLRSLPQKWCGVADIVRVLFSSTIVAAETHRLSMISQRESSASITATSLLLHRFVEPLVDFGLLERRHDTGRGALACQAWRTTRRVGQWLRFRGLDKQAE